VPCIRSRTGEVAGWQRGLWSVEKEFVGVPTLPLFGTMCTDLECQEYNQNPPILEAWEIGMCRSGDTVRRVLAVGCSGCAPVLYLSVQIDRGGVTRDPFTYSTFRHTPQLGVAGTGGSTLGQNDAVWLRGGGKRPLEEIPGNVSYWVLGTMIFRFRPCITFSSADFASAVMP
jgi:hypothetical protein